MTKALEKVIFEPIFKDKLDIFPCQNRNPQKVILHQAKHIIWL